MHKIELRGKASDPRMRMKMRGREKGTGELRGKGPYVGTRGTLLTAGPNETSSLVLQGLFGKNIFPII